MRSVSTSTWKGLLVVAISLAAPEWAHAQSLPTDPPPEHRIQPPVGIAAQHRIQPPVGEPSDVWIQPPVGVKSQVRLQPPVGQPVEGDTGFLSLLTSWLRARIGLPIG
jgi:hypothetical protein